MKVKAITRFNGKALHACVYSRARMCVCGPITSETAEYNLADWVTLMPTCFTSRAGLKQALSFFALCAGWREHDRVAACGRNSQTGYSANSRPTGILGALRNALGSTFCPLWLAWPRVVEYFSQFRSLAVLLSALAGLVGL